MILPWLRGLLNWNQAPLTWTLMGLNVLFFLLTLDTAGDLPSLNKREIQWAGRYYAQMQHEEIPAGPVALLLKGSQALQDPKFFDQLPTFQPAADVIEFKNWQQRVTEFKVALDQRPADRFGLQAGGPHVSSWITYQFMHAGFMHLLGNMATLLVFGAALENITGSAVLVGEYLIGGLVGAWFFLWLSPGTTAPMVGASASLSAVMAFYAIIERRKRVRFFYFLSPSPGYWGDIYLPTLLILPLFFVEDVASYFSTSKEFGAGVAYAAHMGGATFGIVTALIFRWGCARFPRWERILYASYSRSRTEAP